MKHYGTTSIVYLCWDECWSLWMHCIALHCM